MHRAGAVRKGTARHARLCMPCAERLVFRFVPEQRRVERIGGRGAVCVQLFHHTRQVQFLVGIQRRAQRHKIKAVFRAGPRHAQRLVEALFQLGQKCERPAQIQHVAANLPALRKARDGLVHHGIENAGRHIPGLCALVDEGLDIAFGKHAAAAGNGICFFRMPRGFVHFVGRHLQQRCHLVNERAGAARAASVHAHLGTARQKQDLRIFAAQLAHHVRIRRVTLCRHPCGKHLLYEGHAAGVGQAHAGRTGDGKLRGRAVQHLSVHALHQLRRFFHDVGKMTLIGFVCNIQRVVQHHAFDGGGPDVKPDLQTVLPFPLSGAPGAPQPAGKTGPPILTLSLPYIIVFYRFLSKNQRTDVNICQIFYGKFVLIYKILALCPKTQPFLIKTGPQRGAAGL